ncbi:MAG: maleylacetate reductase [Chloroflexota bacterium]|nr:maleylacetate reductase [Chloroflexota bacterium]
MTGEPYTWEALPARVVSGRGALGRVGAEVERLGARRVLLIAGGRSTAAALASIGAQLGDRVAAVIPGSAQHVPELVAIQAIERGRAAAADAVVSVGGGSATGLGKAVVLELDVPLVAVPTTYSGSEMTPIHGRTRDGRKETGRDLRVLPRAVVYDPDLCVGMPAGLAGASGMNALAHCAEALWVTAANPITSALAVEGMRRLLHGLPRVVADPGDVAGHAECLTGACLAGTALAQVGTGIHHRTCHVLGGGWNLPHAETHGIVLPHAVALVSPRAPRAMAQLAAVLGGEPAEALFDLASSMRLPTALAGVGMPAGALDEAADRIAAVSEDDPLAGGRDRIRAMLDDAYRGSPPATRLAATQR